MVKGKKTEGVNSHQTRQKKYHRRSPWACDECRLRKRKCDGQQPCQLCKQSEHECTYHFRRPAPPPTQRIRILEEHLRYAQSFLQDLEKRLPSSERPGIGQALKTLDFTVPAEQAHTPLSGDDAAKRLRLVNMMADCDRIVNHSPWSTSFYGASSGLAFVLRTLELFQLGDCTTTAEERFNLVAELFNLPLPRKMAVVLPTPVTLPNQNVALSLLDAMFQRCHPLVLFLHEHQFRSMVSQIYQANSQGEGAFDRFLPILHFTLALGYLFDVRYHRQNGCHAALQEAVEHFLTARDMVSFTECDDLLSLQTLLCAALFLISTSRILAAHPIIGLASSAALRLGLHSAAANELSMSADQRRTRTRVFAATLKLDMYASLMLGVPPFIQQKNIELPQSHGGTPPDDVHDLGMEISAKHLELLQLTLSSRELIFTKRSGESVDNNVDLRQLAEVEKNLQTWTLEASSLLSRQANEHENAVVKYELEMHFNLSQMMLFRPFLHYLRVMADGGTIPLHQSQHALACIKIASNTIVSSELAFNQGLILPASWISVYTIFLSIMCLVFLIAAHHGTSHPSEAWRKAFVGIKTLAALRCVDDGASICFQVVKMAVNHLSHTVDFDFNHIELTTKRLCESLGPDQQQNITAEALLPATPQSKISDAWTVLDPINIDGGPGGTVMSEVDKMLARAEGLDLTYGFEDLLEMDDDA